MMDSAYQELIKKIIEKQSAIIGPLAVEQAKKVSGLKIDGGTNGITIVGDKLKVVDELIAQYQTLFGQTSVEVCKDAGRDIVRHMKPDEIPPLLR